MSEITTKKHVCYIINECHAQYTSAEIVFEDLEMATKYSAELQKEADKCKLNVEYRVKVVELVMSKTT